MMWVDSYYTQYSGKQYNSKVCVEQNPLYAIMKFSGAFSNAYDQPSFA